MVLDIPTQYAGVFGGQSVAKISWRSRLWALWLAFLSIGFGHPHDVDTAVGFVSHGFGFECVSVESTSVPLVPVLVVVWCVGVGCFALSLGSLSDRWSWTGGSVGFMAVDSMASLRKVVSAHDVRHRFGSPN